jgi:hypothetical protein
MQLYFIFKFYLFIYLRQDLVMYPRLVWNSQSSCLSFPSARVTDLDHHTWSCHFMLKGIKNVPLLQFSVPKCYILQSQQTQFHQFFRNYIVTYLINWKSLLSDNGTECLGKDLLNPAYGVLGSYCEWQKSWPGSLLSCFLSALHYPYWVHELNKCALCD